MTDEPADDPTEGAETAPAAGATPAPAATSDGWLAPGGRAVATTPDGSRRPDGRAPDPTGWQPPDGDLPRVPGAAHPAVTTRAGSWFAGLDPRGWRTTIVVATLMVSAVVGVNLVNAAVPLPAEPANPVDPGPALPGTTPLPDGPAPADPGPVSPGTPVEVGAGVVLYPPAGWSVVGSDDGQVVIQKASAVVLAATVPFPGTPAELADAYRASFFEAGQFSGGEPQSVQIGNGIPAVSFPYTGIADGAQLDGVIFAGVSGETGIILNAIVPAGGLGGISDDLEVIVGTLQLAPEGEG